MYTTHAVRGIAKRLVFYSQFVSQQKLYYLKMAEVLFSIYTAELLPMPMLLAFVSCLDPVFLVCLFSVNCIH